MLFDPNVSTISAAATLFLGLSVPKLVLKSGEAIQGLLENFVTESG